LDGVCWTQQQQVEVDTHDTISFLLVSNLAARWTKLNHSH